MRKNIDLYSRICVAIILAFLTSQLLVQEVFLAQSPQLRPDIADRVVETSLAMINLDNWNIFRSRSEIRTETIAQNDSEAREQLESVQFKPTIVSGVYAKETDNASMIRINVSEVDWIEVDYQHSDGTTETIRIPRGTEPPPPGLF